MKEDKTKRIRTMMLMVALIASALFVACEKDDPSITVSGKNNLKQTAYADESSTGQGVTFTAKDDWTASVRETATKSGSSVSWVKLTHNGVETYNGSAGTYNLVIAVETNYTGKRREATVDIACGTDKVSVSVVQEGTTKNGETPAQDPVELKSPISENTTLKKLGLPVDYIYKSSGFLDVTGTAVLTIEPGVTIQFAHTGRTAGLHISSKATVKAQGLANDRIRFIGAFDSPGSWYGIRVESDTDNRFDYCDFLNIGSYERKGYSCLEVIGGRAGITHCTFTNGLGTGLYLGNSGSQSPELSAFNNNVFEGFNNEAPVFISSNQSLHLLEKFDMTSDFTRNAKQYIELRPYFTKDVTINPTTVPYYFVWGLNGGDFGHTLTINEGVTIYLEEGFGFNGYTAGSGRFIINGTASKKVKFTRLPGTSGYWHSIYFDGMQGSVINHCIFEYGGANFGAVYGNLVIFKSAELTLNNVEINHSDSYGVTILSDDYTLNHSNVTFFNSRLGNVWDRSVTPNVVSSNL